MFSLAPMTPCDMKKFLKSTLALVGILNPAQVPTGRLASPLHSATLMFFTNTFRVIALLFIASTGTSALAGSVTNAELWRATDDMRNLFFETTIGPLPRTMKQMPSMANTWPRGGLYVIPAKRLGDGLVAYTTFGLSNPDMPASARIAEARANGGLRPDAPADPHAPHDAGYGYELLVLAAKDQPWAINILQWAVNAEIGRDARLLALVDRDDGHLIRLNVGSGTPLNVLFAQARPPLPAGGRLVGVEFALLVATVVTDDEAQWALTNGRAALLDKLDAAGVGQASVLGRPAAVR
jgi:hypothetical protein